MSRTMLYTGEMGESANIQKEHIFLDPYTYSHRNTAPLQKTGTLEGKSSLNDTSKDVNTDNKTSFKHRPSLSSEDVLIEEDHSVVPIAMQETNDPFVFHLMSIISDKQELGLVEKVHVCEDQILKLCSRLLPESVDSRYPDSRINFEALNSMSLPVVGLYGDKRMLGAMLQKMNAIGNDTYMKIMNDEIEPGLYAALAKHCILLFYWHQGKQIEVAARKNISCNFIRYLIDLCKKVFICVEEENVFDDLYASASVRQAKQRRTKRLKILQVQSSANDVIFSAGFELFPLVSPPRALPVDFQVMTKNTPFFCHGNHRCAFITPLLKESYISKRTEDIPVSFDALSSLAHQWVKEYSLDFSVLRNEELVIFLEYSGLPEFEEIKRFEQSTKIQREREEKNLNIANLISELEDKVVDNLLSILPNIYDIFSCLPGWEERGNNGMDSADDPFEFLEQTLTDLLNGRKLIFVGSEIKIGTSFECIINHHEGVSNPISVDSCFMLIADGSEYPAFFTKQGHTKGPIFLGDYVSLLNRNKKSHSFCAQGRITEVRTSGEAIRRWIDEILPPLLETVNDNLCFLAFLVSEDGTEGIRNLGDDFLNKVLDEKEGKTSKLSTTVKQLLMDLHDCDTGSDKLKSPRIVMVREFLLNEDANEIMTVMSLAASTLQIEVQEEFEQFKRKLLAFTLNESAIRRLQETVQEWEVICMGISNYLEQEVKEHLLPLWRKNIAHYIQKVFEEDLAKRRSAMTQSFKDQRNAFFQQLKSKLGGYRTRPSKTRMVIKSCKANSDYFNRIKSYFTLPRLKIGVTKEEVEKPRIQWKIVELVPRKKDIEELCLNAMHMIKPSCSVPFDLLSIDPENEELKMVVFLKSGELIIFLLMKDEGKLDLYLSPSIGRTIAAANPIRTFRRGFDLLSFEESTRYLALYDAQTSKVSLFRFDERYRHVDWTGVELVLDIFSGSSHLTWMTCIPGKAELALVDDTNRLRVAELHHQPLMKPRHISLPGEFISGCISEDGMFLFALLRSHVSDISQGKSDLHNTEMFVYLLGDDMQFLKSSKIGTSVSDVTDLKFKLVYYVNQVHLVVHSKKMVDRLSSYLLRITSASEVLHFQEMSKLEELQSVKHKSQKEKVSCATLDYVYHIYDKFAIHPPLCREAGRNQNFHIILKPEAIKHSKESMEKCKNYLKMLLSQIENEKGKEFGKYNVTIYCHLFEDLECNNAIVGLSEDLKNPVGDWMKLLACLVPIQICRAHNNAIQPLVNGLQIASHASYADSISLANLLRFGMYDSILRQWEGSIKVISSMGKQSSGKSYLLNHLAGSLLDVAGGRCTDGVWLTARIEKDCLYVLLDFEGLGSFERTEQEDMLLSVLNAAVSNLTIFNKKDFHLDKETETVFNRFQDGVSIVKSDDKLFKGLFYIAIKDVDAADVEDLKDEFHKKLYQICQRSKENFLTKMYNGEVEIAAMPPFTRKEYYKDSLLEIASTIADVEYKYLGGRAFLRDLKLVIAQIAAKDWTPFDAKRVAMKIDILRKNIASAVNRGQLVSNDRLKNFDAEEEIIDEPLAVHDLTIGLHDTGLELAAEAEDYAGNERILEQLRLQMEHVLRRSGNDNIWHNKFIEFLHVVAKRREDRVKKWIECNTAEFVGNNEVQKLQLEVNLSLAEVKQGLEICSLKCSRCFWKCVLHKGHASDHLCMGDHVCAEKCTYCSMDPNQAEIYECQSLAGHEGDHDCKKLNHTCGKNCQFYDRSSNCSKSCCMKANHEGSHRCNSLQHLCKEICSLEDCKNSCIIQIETGQHEKHVCQERYCPKKCIIKGCRRRCGYEDHFHQLTSSEHLCGSEHPCPKKCEQDGICEIFTELVTQIRSFKGRRGSFEYEHVSEQNGLRKDCCIPIPAFQQSHDGPHVHTENPNVVHYCDVKCHACGYFCQRPKNHPGLHNTVHGNMRHVYFSSEKEDVNILDRKYTWGESGLAEMCNMHCKAQGRGHVHLIRCPTNDGLVCSSNMYDGARHETQKYGPDMDVSKDEFTHEAYWKQMRFEDPCTEEDQKEFALCNHQCVSDEHVGADGTHTNSYCVEKLWHEPVTCASVVATGGHITVDGHAFSCNHTKNFPHHVIFIIDKSGSMSDADIKPTMNKFALHHNCRLGCVYEAILRFITTRRKTSTTDILSVVLFDMNAVTALEMQEMKEDIVDQLLVYRAYGSTSYSSGLKLAQNILINAGRHPTYAQMKPVVIFLSDGGNNDGADPIFFVNSMQKEDSRTILHTIMFGRDPAASILEKMAQAGNGTFQLSLDEVQLARSFETLAVSLKPTVAALL